MGQLEHPSLHLVFSTKSSSFYVWWRLIVTHGHAYSIFIPPSHMLHRHSIHGSWKQFLPTFILDRLGLMATSIYAALSGKNCLHDHPDLRARPKWNWLRLRMLGQHGQIRERWSPYCGTLPVHWVFRPSCLNSSLIVLRVYLHVRDSVQNFRSELRQIVRQARKTARTPASL
jgi:hypothetical protein